MLLAMDMELYTGIYLRHLGEKTNLLQLCTTWYVPLTAINIIVQYTPVVFKEKSERAY